MQWGCCGRTAEVLLEAAGFSLASTRPKPRRAGVTSDASSAGASCRLSSTPSRGVPDGSVGPERPAGFRGRRSGQLQPAPPGKPGVLRHLIVRGRCVWIALVGNDVGTGVVGSTMITVSREVPRRRFAPIRSLSSAMFTRIIIRSCVHCCLDWLDSSNRRNLVPVFRSGPKYVD